MSHGGLGGLFMRLFLQCTVSDCSALFFGLKRLLLRCLRPPFPPVLQHWNFFKTLYAGLSQKH